MNRFEYNSGFDFNNSPNYPEPFDDLDYDLIDPTDALLLEQSFFIELAETEEKGLLNTDL